MNFFTQTVFDCFGTKVLHYFVTENYIFDSEGVICENYDLKEPSTKEKFFDNLRAYLSSSFYNRKKHASKIEFYDEKLEILKLIDDKETISYFENIYTKYCKNRESIGDTIDWYDENALKNELRRIFKKDYEHVFKFILKHFEIRKFHGDGLRINVTMNLLLKHPDFLKFLKVYCSGYYMFAKLLAHNSEILAPILAADIADKF